MWLRHSDVEIRGSLSVHCITCTLAVQIDGPYSHMSDKIHILSFCWILLLIKKDDSPENTRMNFQSNTVHKKDIAKQNGAFLIQKEHKIIKVVQTKISVGIR